jgi:hypothetical protein
MAGENTAIPPNQRARAGTARQDAGKLRRGDPLNAGSRHEYVGGQLEAPGEPGNLAHVELALTGKDC